MQFFLFVFIFIKKKNLIGFLEILWGIHWIDKLMQSLNQITFTSQQGFCGQEHSNNKATKVNMAPKEVPELLPQSEKKHGNSH